MLENLDVSGGSSRCYYHHGHAIVMRDSVVHDCPRQGILGADNDSGSLTLERVEVFGSGGGDRDHQIYMATDEVAHPGSVFRMVGCYVHDGNGGNNVKSRAERNEIYYNWIEGGFYHELELIGPDPAGGVPEGQAREDSDVVGNVLCQAARVQRGALRRRRHRSVERALPVRDQHRRDGRPGRGGVPAVRRDRDARGVRQRAVVAGRRRRAGGARRRGGVGERRRG